MDRSLKKEVIGQIGAPLGQRQQEIVNRVHCGGQGLADNAGGYQQDH